MEENKNLLTEAQAKILEERAEQDAEKYINHVFQQAEDKSQSLVEDEFSGFEEDDKEKLKKRFQEHFLETLHNLI